MNYQCWGCEAVFSEDEAARSTESDCSEYAGTRKWDRTTYLNCPHCGSEEISEHKEESDDEN